MNKDKYSKAMDQLHTSEDFNVKTARLMKSAIPDTKSKYLPVKRMAIGFAGAAIILSAGVFALNYNHVFTAKEGVNRVNTNPITVAKVELPSSTGNINARMMPLFVYQGRIYLQYNTMIEATDGIVSEEDMLALRGDYLGKTKGSIDEWSKQDDYATEFASNIGESDVYTVKGYDSKYRLMVYMEYDGGFTCDIYDSFGGLTMDSGADFFDLLKLKENVTSYQWESYDSWNNGMGERVDASTDDVFNTFLDKLYDAVPVDESIDKLIEDSSYDSQKFLYLKTKDNLITTLRLLKDGYVYAPEVGFFQVDQAAFDAFYESMPVTENSK
jgi:hypothetical protein